MQKPNAIKLNNLAFPLSPLSKSPDISWQWMKLKQPSKIRRSIAVACHEATETIAINLRHKRKFQKLHSFSKNSFWLFANDTKWSLNMIKERSIRLFYDLFFAVSCRSTPTPIVAFRLVHKHNEEYFQNTSFVFCVFPLSVQLILKLSASQ